MKKKEFMVLYQKLIDRGYEEEIDWSENLQPCDNAELFLQEYIWVVLNSGMKNQIARKIYERIKTALSQGRPISTVFKHKGKADAILNMTLAKDELFTMYQDAEDKLIFLENLSYIGKVTKYHLAKNLGVDTAKPDRHLVRIAKQFNMSCFELCEKLSKEMGLRIATIDVVLWRAANLGLI